MKPLYKGLLLGAIQVALVCSLGAKLLLDRATRPRVWVKSAPVDPELSIRGRYMSLRLEVPTRGFAMPPPTSVPRQPSRGRDSLGDRLYAKLELEGGQLVAVPAVDPRQVEWVTLHVVNNELFADLWEPLAYFIPERAKDPSVRPPGEELWVEVTLPRKGPPRPLRLGVKKAGELTPLDLP